MNKFHTFVVELPDSIEQRKTIFETISAVVQENGGRVVGQSQDDEMTLVELLEKRLAEDDVQHAHEELATMARGVVTH